MACSGSTCPLPPFFSYLGLKWDVDVVKAGRDLAPRVSDWGAVLGGPVGCSSTLECNCVWSPRDPLGNSPPFATQALMIIITRNTQEN